MKRCVLSLVMVCFGLLGKAQTWAEWFEQKKTRIRYLTEQVAALRMYGATLQKGYRIIQEGTGVISAIKSGELALHKRYFHSLRQVKHPVKNSSDMKDIELLESSILRVYNKYKRFIRVCTRFTEAEKHYFASVFGGVLAKTKKAAEEAGDVLADDKLQLSDDERLRRLERVRRDLRDLYYFSVQFEQEITGMALVRERAHLDLQKIQQLN